MLILRHISPSHSRTLPIESRTLVIGGSPECDAIIDDPKAAEVIATIQASETGDLCRLASVDVTRLSVNGKRPRKEMDLRPGDRIEIRSHIFIIDRSGEAPPSDPGTSHASFDHLKRFAEAVGREKDLRKLLRSIVRALLKILGGSDAFIFKLDSAGKPEVFVSSSEDQKPVEFSDTVIQAVLAKQEGLFIPHALTDPKYGGAYSISNLKLLSVICCPIITADKVCGVIYLGSRKATVSYSSVDLETLSVYAAIAGMLINHVEYISQQNESIKRLAHAGDHAGIIAESRVMHEVLNQAANAASSDVVVVIEGETGTGKDVLARHIHQVSSRAKRPLVVVNCGALQKDLLESELFGHKKGSFTGAFQEHEGLFRAANEGTLFLDEIGEMDAALQAKLLRTIESGKIRPVGSSIEEDVDVRLVCATNRGLIDLVKEGLFREDLYYRLNQFRIVMPPLRERGDDVVLLAYYFLEKFRAEHPEKKIHDFHPDSRTFMTLYPWPGNVRELASVVHRAVITAQEPLLRIDAHVAETMTMDLEKATAVFQRKLVAKALDVAGGNKDGASKLLGIHRATLYRFLSDPA